MDKLAIIVLAVLLTVGAAWWVFDNEDGLSDAVENGGKTVNEKMSTIDYDGTQAPGTGAQDGNWVSTPAAND